MDKKKKYIVFGLIILAFIYLINKFKRKTITMITEADKPEQFNKFKTVTDKVIQKMEGGYYHPNMMKKDPIRFKDYGFSGETMFGLDRHAGHDLFYSSKRLSSNVFDNLKNIEGGKYKYKSEAAQNFWNIIDNSAAKINWKWNSVPEPEKAQQLRFLASEIMFPKFVQNFNTFLSPEARNIILDSAPLMFNFSYATWNGPGWFKKFASDINEAVKKGITDEDKLIKVAIWSRTNEGLKKGSAANSLIKRGGEKIATFINDIKF